MAEQKLEFLFHHSSSLWTSPLVFYRDFLHLGGGNTLSVIKMRLFAKTKTILHAITVLFVLPCLLTSIILTKLAPVATVWSQLIFLLLFNCVQASDHTSSAVEHHPRAAVITTSRTACGVLPQTEQRAHQWGSAVKIWCMVLPTCVANCCASTSLLVPNVCRCPVTTLVTRTRRVRPKEDRWCWFSCNLSSSWEINARSLSHWDRQGC